jgi:Zn-dependent protease with chaperone function
MNFFEHQHLARRNSRRLVLLFVLALLVLIVVTNMLLAIVWRVTIGTGGLPPYFYVANTLVILLLVLGGAWFETWNLREGGDAVAKMVGGRLATGRPRDGLEKRLLNIVEEMALAAGIAVPRVYVLEREEGINAFAAGTGPNDSVVAVTRGTLERMSRDELQGVVAHEFSHIVHGDVQLNLRLTGLVFGLTLLSHLGELLLRSGIGGGRTSDKRGGSTPLLAGIGIILLVMGWIGTLFGRMIKAAVSREREFLADASAVQFTRNQDGIGGALRKIAGLHIDGHAGSTIQNVHAETLSHMFMASARTRWLEGWLATHPPLPERIKRVYGRAQAPLPSSVQEPPAVQTAPELQPLAYEPLGLLGAAAVLAPALHSVPPPTPAAAQTALLDACQDGFGAQAAVLAWLLAPDVATQAQQLATLPPGISAAQVERLAQQAQLAGNALRLSTFHAAAPHLKMLDSAQRTAFLQVVDAFVLADARVLPFEFALQTLIATRLMPARVTPVVYHHIQALQAPLKTTLAMFNALHQQDADAPPNYTVLRNALAEIVKLAPLQKPQVIKLWAGLRDGSVLAEELAQAMAAAIDCPWPIAAAGMAPAATTTNAVVSTSVAVSASMSR